MSLPIVAGHVRASCLCLAAWFAASAPAAAFQTGPGCGPDVFEPNDSCSQSSILTPGQHTGLTTVAGDTDVHRILVNPGKRLDIVLTLVNPDPAFLGTVRLVQDDGSIIPCAISENQLALRFLAGTQPTAAVAWTTSPASASVFLLEVDTFSTTCTTYDLDVSVTADPCASLAPDALEDNDDCATATPIGVGTFAGLNVSLHDPDVYSLQLAAGELFAMRIDVSTPNAVLDVVAWPALFPCGTLLVASSGAVVYGGQPGGLYVFNDSSAPLTYLVAVQTSRAGTLTPEFCADYSMQLSSNIDPCGVASGDAFEPNSDCFFAPPLTSSQTGLSIRAGGDQDFYAVGVPPRSTVRFMSTPSAPGEVREMTLWSGCNLDTSDFLASSVPLDFAPGERRRWLQWSNVTTAPRDTRLMVHAPAGFFPNAFCDAYDLALEFTLGVPFCNAARNASGGAARLTASGSTLVGQGSLTLVAEPVPTVTTGLVFFGASNQPAVPFGYGFRCIANPIVRLPVVSTGTGTLQTTVNWTGPASVITPGSTWSFQTWFRDTAGGVPGFNTSEGLRVSFQ